MHNKKGFTLVEMLVVLALLVVISLFVVPEVTSIYKKLKENEYERFLSDVFLSTEVYIQKNIDSYPNLNEKNNKVYVYFTELLESGYLKSTIIDTKNNKSVKEENFTVEVFLNDNNEYTYKLLEEYYVPVQIGTITQELLNISDTYTYMDGTYLKGEQSNNYVWYNGFLWRIMGKNSDGTIRLITEENVATVIWGTTTWDSEGYLNDWLNNYFLNNLDSNKSKIVVTSDWCINITTDNTISNSNCSGTTISSRVGLISLDEYISAGTYLINSQNYWLITSYNNTNSWYIDYTGTINYSNSSNFYGVRPVINIDASAISGTGDGSLSNPYLLNESSSDENDKISNLVSSGEYVSLNDNLFRVVSKTDDGVKLIYDGYYNEDYTFGNNNTFSSTTGIGQILNTSVLDWINDCDVLISSNWYQFGFSTGTSYVDILDITDDFVNSKVGLIRVGEMLSGQSASILTNNYTEVSNYANTKSYWTLNKGTNTTSAWVINNNGSSSLETSNFSVRPVIVVDNNSIIKSGTGSLKNPYIVSI